MTESNGLYYMRARYYDQHTGRFISEDPIGFAGGDVNLYAYVQNNPVLLVDPSGESGFIGGAIGVVAGGVGGYITSGSFWGATVGAIAGGVTGFVTPSLSYGAGATTAAFVSGAAGSYAGQVAGSLISENDNPYSNVNVPAIIGSGAGAGAAAALGAGAIATAFFNRTIGILAQGAFEGVFGGAGGLVGQSLGNPIKSSSSLGSATTTSGGCRR